MLFYKCLNLQIKGLKRLLKMVSVLVSEKKFNLRVGCNFTELIFMYFCN